LNVVPQGKIIKTGGNDVWRVIFDVFDVAINLPLWYSTIGGIKGV
jgi:hypothetical protein